MAMSTDSDLLDIVPDILSFGIDSFADEHARAQADIERHIRAVWWDKRGFAGELKPQYLTESQWTRSAVYLVLWKYALPQLTNWVDNDRFLGMIDFYKSRYGEEIEAVFRDGVEYDDDQNNVIDDDEKIPINDGRLVR
tara:strand:- start:1348 stop:1761 length:414 start_codon:yes stop_codon:yes gene_type:complete